MSPQLRTPAAILAGALVLGLSRTFTLLFLMLTNSLAWASEGVRLLTNKVRLRAAKDGREKA